MSSPPTNDLKRRVLYLLNKLADRDTQSIASKELESLAKNLTKDTFSTFLLLLLPDPSSKPFVRRQVLHLIATLSFSHGESLSPHLPKLISALTGSLRDPNSSVRTACISASSAISSSLPSSFSSLSRSLLETLTLELDVNSQTGAAMCLAAAIEAAEAGQYGEFLKKALPRLGKLVRSEGFKPKGAVLGLIGSVVGAGGASENGALEWVVPCLVKFLSSEDWVARKAAAEALGRVAVTEKELAKDYKGSCLGSLESRRFDKVKVVRETMNRTLGLWKEVPGVSEESPAILSQSTSSTIDDSKWVGASPPFATKCSTDGSFKTPLKIKPVPSNSSPHSNASCVTTAEKSKTSDRKSRTDMLHKPDNFNEPSTWGVEVSPLPDASCGNVIKAHDSEILESRGNEDQENPRPETKRVLFSSIHRDKLQKLSGLRSGSRVVPYIDDEVCYVKDLELNNPTEEFNENQEFEDLSLIREQLLQIENQQSNLLDLLQRFIGKSQHGISSLETRVNGLEMALDEISYDLALSSGRIQSTDSTENICCKLPGTEFLSPKFWRKAEGRYSTSRVSSAGNIQLHHIRSASSRNTSSESNISESQRSIHKVWCGSLVNQSPNVLFVARGKPGYSSIQTIDDDLQACNASSITLMNQSSRLHA